MQDIFIEVLHLCFCNSFVGNWIKNKLYTKSFFYHTLFFPELADPSSCATVLFQTRTIIHSF